MIISMKKGHCNCDLIVTDRILLQELVDKATPKKIRYENAPKPSMAYMYSCPNCGRMLGVNCKPTYINYCDECGTKLDWSDSDEKDNR